MTEHNCEIECKECNDGKKVDRRTALKKLAGYTAGAALGGMALANPGKLFAADNSEFPWPYKKLDVEQVRKLGHEGYYLGNCSSGSFYAVMSALDEKVGEPYDQFPYTPPNNMMHFGGGGIVGQGMCCGALLGSFAAINQVTDSATAKELSSELMKWYKDTSLPTDTANDYGTNQEFLVDEYHSTEFIEPTVADSALCRDSVGNWMSETGISHGDLRRKERCARLTGDVVAKAVELINNA
ncbi:MAG: C-GCAxxG-C-C family (seleno)protein [Bacillota bacterium]